MPPRERVSNASNGMHSSEQNDPRQASRGGSNTGPCGTSPHQRQEEMGRSYLRHRRLRQQAAQRANYSRRS
jgi:hypothetical protein